MWDLQTWVEFRIPDLTIQNVAVCHFQICTKGYIYD